MNGVLASRGDSGTVTLLTGNKPLHLRHHRGYRVVVYASDATFLDEALDGEPGWRDLAMLPMTMQTVAHTDLRGRPNPSPDLHRPGPPRDRPRRSCRMTATVHPIRPSSTAP